jgi:predicted nuclease with TOPRIM domain
MAPEVEKVDATVAINQFYQSNSSTNKVVKGENSTVISKSSSSPVELEELQYDFSELIHILHVTERSSVKEIIQADIQLLLSKIESIEYLNKNQLETNISWSRVTTLKQTRVSTRNRRLVTHYT